MEIRDRVELLGIKPGMEFEIGISRIFEERVEETIVHDASLGELPKQRPDRVIGLRETKNIRHLLDQPPRGHPGTQARDIRGLVRCAPYKWQSSPLLYPFLVLEAKSDVAPTSFKDISTQTSFPIWSLLNLQRDLRLFHIKESEGPEALVWFLGYRGNDWKLYGCYITQQADSKCDYNIHDLQGGDIASKDGALQLLLLLDLIADWARDTLRPSIIAQLRSLATGRDLDEISLGPDSDILSKEKTLRDWLSRVPSTIAPDETAHATASQSIQPSIRKDLTSVSPPNTELGIVRPMTTTIFQLAGLRVTAGNVESLLALSDGPASDKEESACARKLLAEICGWDEVFVVLGAYLDDLERLWTDERVNPEPFDEGSGAEFYAMFEYRCFIDTSWDIIREVSYLAISETAFTMLRKHARFRVRMPLMDSLRSRSRPCSGELIRDAVSCLRSGSAWQALISALSSTLFVFAPEPSSKRGESSNVVESLGLRHLREPEIRYFVEFYLQRAANPAPNWKRTSRNSLSPKRRKVLDTEWEQRTSNRSFGRTSRRVERCLSAAHDPACCVWCRRDGQDLHATRYRNEEDATAPTAYGAILVASLVEESKIAYERQERHDLCLFVLDFSPWLEDTVSISTVVEDLAQNKATYHTIRHQTNLLGLSNSVWRDDPVTWNLPCPYRRNTARQGADIKLWIQELRGEPTPKPSSSVVPLPLWVHQQILLHFLRRNKSYDEALEALVKYRDVAIEKEKASRRRTGLGAAVVDASCVRLDTFWDTVRSKDDTARTGDFRNLRRDAIARNFLEPIPREGSNP
ncbi:uncharacterized protein LTR77_007186 [Saxophila tyrrhenica]|uniref:Uncharacterized protein n=1 Tax=Saxophila tyrrhenica TaxID=1690608 RepID=A0AAV9P4G5_9PEZI|nr:hypothetical protein LTR77_007186 [Saxophila tyrrhenica]